MTAHNAVRALDILRPTIEGQNHYALMKTQIALFSWNTSNVFWELRGSVEAAVCYANASSPM